MAGDSFRRRPARGTGAKNHSDRTEILKRANVNSGELDQLVAQIGGEILARVSRGLGGAMSGLAAGSLRPEELLETRGW